MVVVFLFVLVLHFLKHFIRFFVKQEQERQLEGRMRAQINEQSELNVKEDFPKFARIDRKLNKLKDELKKLSTLGVQVDEDYVVDLVMRILERPGIEEELRVSYEESLKLISPEEIKEKMTVDLQLAT